MTPDTMEQRTATKPRIPFYTEEFYSLYKAKIASAMLGNSEVVSVKGSGYAESSLYTQIRSMLKWAEDEDGVVGAKKLKVNKSGSQRDRKYTIQKISRKLAGQMGVV